MLNQWHACLLYIFLVAACLKDGNQVDATNGGTRHPSVDSTKALPTFLQMPHCNNILADSSTGKQLPRMLATQTNNGDFTYGDDRIALVTGAGRGIGKCIAETFAKRGIKKILCVSRSTSSCDEVVKSLKELGCTGYAYGVDVSDGAAVKAACASILDEHGAVDILVNNAGITKDNLMLRMSHDDWESVISTNLNSAFYFTSGLLRAMVRKKYGRIINIASIVGITGNPGQSNYCAAKAGLIGMTKSLSKEVASRGITVNAIAPGFITSAMTDKIPKDVTEELLKHIPSGNMGAPQDVAYLTAFLATEQARYITGEAIPIDGGMF